MSSEESDSDIELQNALQEGRLKPGLNILQEEPKKFANNVAGLTQKLSEMTQPLPWIELLTSVQKEAPLAPELAAQMVIHKDKIENKLKNNKKLPQISPDEDPVLNDFKRETIFYRQAQAAVLEAIPKLKALGLPIKRPDDYFAEMAKSDEHMQKIRSHLNQKKAQQERSERVKQLRAQRKDGKMHQIQNKLERQKEKRMLLEQVKKVRKGHSKDLSFLDGKKNKSKKGSEKQNFKDKKFGFGGKKRGSKINTKDSASEISDYRRPNKPGKGKGKNKKASGNQRMGKNRRQQNKARNKK